MSEVQTRVFLVLVLVNFQLIAAKPIFGTGLYCDFFCDEEYDSSTSASTSSYEDLLDMFLPCDGCPTNPSTLRPGAMNANQPPFNFMIPPNFNGMNVTMVNQNGNWLMNFVPWGAQPATPAPPTTAAPAAATTSPPAAPATTAAPGATTAAAGATTAAAGATTAAPTTAAAGK